MSIAWTAFGGTCPCNACPTGRASVTVSALGTVTRTFGRTDQERRLA